jgi:hypothetical protein
VVEPQPQARPIYYTYATSRTFWFSVFAVICYIIALVVGADWVTESGKLSDVLVFLSLGSAFFAAAHVP